MVTVVAVCHIGIQYLTGNGDHTSDNQSVAGLALDMILHELDLEVSEVSREVRMEVSYLIVYKLRSTEVSTGYI